MQDYPFRIWPAKQNSFRQRHKQDDYCQDSTDQQLCVRMLKITMLPQSNNEAGTHVNIPVLLTGSTVTVECKDGWLLRGRYQKTEDRMHHNQDQAIHDNHPLIHGGIPLKWGTERQQIAVREKAYWT